MFDQVQRASNEASPRPPSDYANTSAPPPSAPSLAQMAGHNLECAMKLNAWSAELRERLYGPRTNKDAGGSASPSQGDFKDTLTSLRYHLDAIGENLSAVSQYLFS